MKNRFIVLIDLSSHSEQLLRFAHDWSKRVGAELLAFHNNIALSPLMTPYETKTTLIDRANYEARERLVKFTENVLPPATPIQHLVSEENMVSVLRELLKKTFNHLVFFGIKGTGLLKKIFIGSQAVNIIDGIDNLIVAMPQYARCCAPKLSPESHRIEQNYSSQWRGRIENRLFFRRNARRRPGGHGEVSQVAVAIIFRQ